MVVLLSEHQASYPLHSLMLVQSLRKVLIDLRSLSVLKRRGFHVQVFAEHAEPRFIWFKLPGYSTLGREKPSLKSGLFQKVLHTRCVYSSHKTTLLYRYVCFYINLKHQGHIQAFTWLWRVAKAVET